MIRIRPFKEKEKEVNEDPNSVANGRFQCLVANGRKKEEAPFHLFPLSPQEILLKPSFFSFDFKVLLYHVLGRYLCISFLFFNL
jgi:hypothetical protein